MKILVTGGLGYIGSHMVVELIKNEYDVIIIDNLSNSEIFILDNIEKITGVLPVFYNINLLDTHKLEEVFNSHKIDGVIHFAAFKSVSESVKNPFRYYNNNLNSLMNILNFMNDKNIENIVFSSSCTVYGQPDKLPVSEAEPFKKATNPYAKTKQISEGMLEDFINSNDKLRGISLRYFNPVGSHNSGLIGELPLGVPDNLVPYVTQTAAGIREELSVFGSDYNTNDGTAIRDYIHVEDLVSSHLVAISRLLSKENSDNYEFYNIGTGKGHSVLEVINAFEKVNNLKLNYSFKGRRDGDIEKIYSDVKKSSKILKWKSERSLDDMMSSAWRWQKNLANF